MVVLSEFQNDSGDLVLLCCCVYVHGVYVYDWVVAPYLRYYCFGLVAGTLFSPTGYMWWWCMCLYVCVVVVVSVVTPVGWHIPLPLCLW